jgi:hypothetical protein
VFQDSFQFVFFLPFDDVRDQSREGGAVGLRLYKQSEKGGVEDIMNLSPFRLG